MKAKLALHVENTILGEGPVWDFRTGKLWWVDIKSHLLHCFDPVSNENQTYNVGQYVGAAVPCQDHRFILALHHGFAFFDPNTHELSFLGDPEKEVPGNRFNDGKCDPAGRFWAGTMKIGLPREQLGNLYCLDADLNISHELSEIYISNGLAWTGDYTSMYYIDTITQRVQVFDYDKESGGISNPRTALAFSGENWPDGMCIDENDHLWIAFYGAGKIICYDPISQEKLAEIEVPAANTTSCAFGGEHLDQLFITSAAKEGDNYGGGLFVVEPGVRGRKANFFVGA